MVRSQLNEIYKRLDKKAHDICQLLNSTFGYYSGHYHKNEAGNYEPDYFPIPVISLNGICDIEIDLNQISITTKLTREDAISYDFEKLKSYSFEAYGVENYLEDFYVAGDTICDMKEKIQKSNEENVFFSFYFPFDVSANMLCALVSIIRKECFFY